MKIHSLRSATLIALILVCGLTRTSIAAELAPEDTPSTVELDESNTPTAEGIRDGSFPEVDVENPTKPSEERSRAITVAADDTVSITKAAGSDVFAMGNTVSVTQSVDGDIFAAGNTIDITIPDGEVTGSLRLAGNLVTINAPVKRNAIIFGNSVHIGADAVINGDTHIYASKIVVDGILEGPASLNGETVIVNNMLSGKTEINATSAAFGDEAVIKAKTDIYSPNDVIATSRVDGTEKITLHETVDTTREWETPPQLRIGMWLVSTFFFLLLGILLILIAPQWFERVVHGMQQKAGATWAKGALAFFVTPIIALALCFTLIGIPLAVVLMFAYMLAMLLGRLFVGMYIGYELVNEKRFTHKTKREVAYFVVGYFILALIMSVPIVGWFAKLLACIWGMGGVLESFKRKRA